MYGSAMKVRPCATHVWCGAWALPIDTTQQEDLLELRTLLSSCAAALRCIPGT